MQLSGMQLTGFDCNIYISLSSFIAVAGVKFYVSGFDCLLVSLRVRSTSMVYYCCHLKYS